MGGGQVSGSPVPAGGRVIWARYSGKCARCKEAFERGDVRIYYYRRPGAKRGRSWCMKCHGAAKERLSEQQEAEQALIGAPKGGETVTRSWPSVTAWTEAIPKPIKDWRGCDNYAPDDWLGSIADGEKLARTGDTRPAAIEAMRKGEAMAAKFSDALASRWTLDYAGAVPSMPHYIAGADRHMRRRRKRASESAPIRVFIDPSSSGYRSAAEVNERIGMIAGMIGRAAQQRPIELWGIIAHSISDNHPAHGTVVNVWPVAAADPASVAGNLSVEVARGIGLREACAIGVLAHKNSRAQLGVRHLPAHRPKDVEKIRRRLVETVPGFGENDIYIPGFIKSDQMSEEWCRTFLAQILAPEGAMA